MSAGKVIGQVRWPDEIMWSDEQAAKQGWLAIVPNAYAQAVAELIEAAKHVCNVSTRTARTDRLAAALARIGGDA